MSRVLGAHLTEAQALWGSFRTALYHAKDLEYGNMVLLHSCFCG